MQVAFHFNVSDRLDYVCRLVRKVRSRHLTVMVCAEPADVSEIDRRLWTLTPHAFLAHAVHGVSPEIWARSAVVLCTEPPSTESRQVFVNLRSNLPELGKRFERLVEIVSTDEPSRAAARQRWRSYVAQGFAPERHDVSAVPPA